MFASLVVTVIVVNDIKILAQLRNLRCVFVPSIGAHETQTAITKGKLSEE